MYCGEANGNPLQYSCLENSIDRGAWWVQFMGSQRVRHDWESSHSLTYMYRWIYVQCIQSFWKRQANKNSFQWSFESFPSNIFFFWWQFFEIEFTYHTIHSFKVYSSIVQLLSHVQLFTTPWTAACQTSLFLTVSWSLLRLMSIESIIPSKHLILCTIQWLFIYPQSWAAITTINSRTFSSTQKETHTL